MPSVMAIVSKGVFEKDARLPGQGQVGEGDTWPIDRYTSKHKRLEPLAAGGALYLVTVRPPDERLWLVAVLEEPRFVEDHWDASPNRSPVTDVTSLKSRLVFDTGKGITAKPGTLGMSLQTPRVLADQDVALLREALGSGTAPKKAKTKKAAKRTNKAVRVKQAAPPPGTSPHLAGALELMQKGRRVDALDRLLAGWADHRSAEVAALIELLGAEIDRSLPAVEGKEKSKQLDERWLDLAGHRRSADVGRLVARFEEASAPMLRRWFAQLEAFAPDPRVGLPALLAACWYSSTGAGPTRTAAFKLATAIGDGRLHNSVDELVRRFKWVEDQARRMASKIAEAPALPEADADAAAQIRAHIEQLGREPPPDEEALFAAAASGADEGEQALVSAILAEPDADPPRLVYADWLLDRGDPRGELIMLQYKRLEGGLSAKEAKTERALLKAHGARWIHPLDAVVDQPRFERGFLSGCGNVTFATEKQREELLGHPLWATVREIDACSDEALIVHLALRSLRSVRCRAKTLAELSLREEPAPLEEATAAFVDLPRFEELIAASSRHYLSAEWMERARQDSLEYWETICRVGSLDKLRRLRLQTAHRLLAEECQRPEAFTWLTASPLAEQLELLALANHDVGPPVAAWLELLDRSPALGRIELRSAARDYYNSPNYSGPNFPCHVSFVIERGASGALDLTLETDWPFHHDELRRLSTVGQSLEGFPLPELPRLRLRYGGKQKRSGPDLKRLAEVAALPVLQQGFETIVLPDGSEA